MKRISFYILLFLLCLGGKTNAQIAQQKYETRGVWLTTLSGLDWPRVKATDARSRERQQQELIRILDQYKRLNLNTVMLQTRVRGTMIYPSALEGWDPCMTGETGQDPGYDPLQFAIDECHKRGMELHCWMVTIPSGNAKVHAQLGSKSVTKTHPELCKRVKDYWYLDPGNPGTKYYLASLCQEIVSRYDVDGIHFDFIRYPENSASLLDRESYKQYGNGRNLSDWRRANITACVREMYNTIKKLKPWVKVTSAPLGKFRDTSRFPSGGWNGYNKVYQDAQAWMKEGIMDGLYPMLYYRGNNFYPFVLDWIENANGRPVIPGLGIYFMHPSEGKWSLADVQRQMNYCRSIGLGVAHYRSKFLTDNTKGLYTWCEQEFYPYPAQTQPMTWLDKTAPHTPQHLQKRRVGGALELTWDACKDPQTNSYVTYNVYRSTSYPVNTNDPACLVAVRLMNNRYVVNNASEADAQYNYVVTAVDRFGNESDTTTGNAPIKLGKIVCEGNQLHLPLYRNMEYVYITDLTERVLRTYTYEQVLNIASLKPGSYKVMGKRKDGHRITMGYFLK